MEERAVYCLIEKNACLSAGRADPLRLVDNPHDAAYFLGSTCSPSDQPQGLRRGFEFQRSLHAA